jgi:hypothetical protein
VSEPNGSSSALPVALGCLTGVGCGLVLIVGCVASWLVLSEADVGGDDASPTAPAPVPPPPASAPPPPSAPALPPPPVLPPPPTSGSVAPPGDVAPRLVRATITVSSAPTIVPVGALCEFDVERVDSPDGSFACRAQVVCGGRLLYGGPEAGFFPCTLYEGPPRHVVGSDANTTGSDGDAAMRLDTHGTLEVWDDAGGANGELRVTARVDAVE